MLKKNSEESTLLHMSWNSNYISKLLTFSKNVFSSTNIFQRYNNPNCNLNMVDSDKLSTQKTNT